MKKNLILAVFMLAFAMPAFAQCNLSRFPEKRKTIDSSYFTTFKTGSLYECEIVPRSSDTGRPFNPVKCGGIVFETTGIGGSRGFDMLIDKNGAEFKITADYLREERDTKQVGNSCIYTGRTHYRQTLPDGNSFITIVQNTIKTEYTIPSY